MARLVEETEAVFIRSDLGPSLQFMRRMLRNCQWFYHVVSCFLSCDKAAGTSHCGAATWGTSVLV